MLPIETLESREWMPRLVDIIHFANEGSLDERLYFSRFGFDKLVVPTGATYISARMADLTVRFNERYLYRRIGAETMPRWQIRLQNKFDEIVDKYNRAYALYDEHAEGIMDDIKTGVRRVTHAQNQASGQDENESTRVDRRIDTPDSRVNENDDYADSYSKSNGDNTTKYGRKDVNDVTDVTEATGILLENINKTIDAYRDIDTQLVKEFENLFLNVFE